MIKSKKLLNHIFCTKFGNCIYCMTRFKCAKNICHHIPNWCNGSGSNQVSLTSTLWSMLIVYNCTLGGGIDLALFCNFENGYIAVNHIFLGAQIRKINKIGYNTPNRNIVYLKWKKGQRPQKKKKKIQYFKWQRTRPTWSKVKNCWIIFSSQNMFTASTVWPGLNVQKLKKTYFTSPIHAAVRAQVRF